MMTLLVVGTTVVQMHWSVPLIVISFILAWNQSK